jgi:hypothetical protein
MVKIGFIPDRPEAPPVLDNRTDHHLQPQAEEDPRPETSAEGWQTGKIRQSSEASQPAEGWQRLDFIL